MLYGFLEGRYHHGGNTVYGTKETGPDHHECECERVWMTVGKENITKVMGTRSLGEYPVGGLWYSHPKPGMCTGDQRIGDGSGCTYRLLGVSKGVNASCMYNQIDREIESLN